jgi:MFS family permease
MQSFYIPVIVGIITTALMAVASKATNKEVLPDADGFYKLKLLKIYNTAGYASIALAIASLSGFFFTKDYGAELFFGMAIIFLLFGVVGLCCVLLYKNYYVRFNASDIEVASMIGKIKSTKWSSITGASFNKNSGYLTLTDKDNQKLKIQQHLKGLPKFISLLEANTRFTAAQLQMPVTGEN